MYSVFPFTFRIPYFRLCGSVFCIHIPVHIGHSHLLPPVLCLPTDCSAVRGAGVDGYGAFDRVHRHSGLLVRCAVETKTHSFPEIYW